MKSPAPDFETLRKAVLRQGQPERVPFFELFADVEIIEAILGQPVGVILTSSDRRDREIAISRIIRFYLEMGYDYVPCGLSPCLPRGNVLLGQDTALTPRENRRWIDENRGEITTWEEFERYQWPTSKDIDYTDLEITACLLPSGMRVFVWTSGVLENVMWLMGYVPMSYAMADSPDLVAAMFERVGSLLLSIHESAAQVEAVGLLGMGDDMGHKTGTMFAPAFLRTYVFPWQKKLVEVAHAKDKPFVLHSCGNLSGIMPDLIHEVRIDGLHSYQDVILPVWEAKAKYGSFLSILGGVDMDLLARGSEEEVRSYVRRVLETCAPGGGYALGTGNSVANYIPVRNYLAMLEEGRSFGI